MHKDFFVGGSKGAKPLLTARERESYSIAKTPPFTTAGLIYCILDLYVSIYQNMIGTSLRKIRINHERNSVLKAQNKYDV